MHRIIVRVASVLALLVAAVAVSPSVAAQGPEPMYNITRWGDYTTMTVAIDATGYSVWPNEFYIQFDCGLAGGFVGMSAMLDDPMNGELSYMTDPSTNAVRWTGYNTANGPGGGTYMVITAAVDTTDCNWPAQGTVLTQWYQGDNFDRQPDITNRAIDAAWFLDAGKTPPTDPAEFWGTNVDNTGWGLTSATPPIIIEGASDSGFGPIAIMETVDTTTTLAPTTSAAPTTTAATPTTTTPTTTTVAATTTAPSAAGGSGSGSGAGGAGGGGGGGRATWLVTIGIIILILATFAAGTTYRRKKRADNMFRFTEELSSLALDLSPAEKRKLVEDFKKQKDKSVYVKYLQGLRDFNLGIREQPPEPPQAPPDPHD